MTTVIQVKPEEQEVDIQAQIDKAIESLSLAKVRLFRYQYNSTFFNVLLNSLPIDWDFQAPTAYTEGTGIFINPVFFNSLKLDEKVGLLVHELWHVALEHVPLAKIYGISNKKRWNIAADYFINNLMVEQGYTLPVGALIDSKYKGMSSVDIYATIPPSFSPEGADDLKPEKSGSEASGNESSSKAVARALHKAHMAQAMSKKPSSYPNGFEEYIEKLFEPKVDWSSVLQNYIDGYAEDDYSYAIPNRRAMALSENLILPTMYSESLGEIAWALDVSASVSNKEIALFNSEVAHVHNDLNATTHVVTFDTDICDILNYEQGEEVSTFNFHGRGGTCLDCVYEYFKARSPKVLVVMTDHYCNPMPEPDFPVIWLIVNNPKYNPSYGTIIHVKVES